MPEIVTVALATVLCFVIGAVYYGVLGNQLATARGGEVAAPGRWTMAVEVLRCLALATVVTVLARWAGVEGWLAGLGYGLLLWVGFPLVLWIGAVAHERTPVRLAALHGGDWLVKLLALGLLVALL